MAEAADFERRLGRIAADAFAAACDAGHAHDDDGSLLALLRAGTGAHAAPPSAVRDRTPPVLDAALAARYADAALRALADLQLRAAARGARPGPVAAAGAGPSAVPRQLRLALERAHAGMAGAPRTVVPGAAAARCDRGIARDAASPGRRRTRARPSRGACDLQSALTAGHGCCGCTTAQSALAPARASTRPDPLAAVVRAGHWMRRLADAPSPQRAGLHGNSAFAMTPPRSSMRARRPTPDSTRLIAAAAAGWRRRPALPGHVRAERERFRPRPGCARPS